MFLYYYIYRVAGFIGEGNVWWKLVVGELKFCKFDMCEDHTHKMEHHTSIELKVL